MPESPATLAEFCDPPPFSIEAQGLSLTFQPGGRDRLEPGQAEPGRVVVVAGQDVGELLGLHRTPLTVGRGHSQRTRSG